MDEETITVRVAPGPSVGEPARVRAPDGVEVINHTTTVGRGQHGTLDFVPLWGTNTLLLRGEYPISEAPYVVSASDPAPGLRVARRLREALGEAGVTVGGAVRLQSRAVGAADQLATLAELRSRPLGDVLERILTNSHNWYADMLTLTLALEVAGSGRFEDGVEVISDFVIGLLPDDAKTQANLWILDGSGLSSSNLVTPTTVVRVLAHALAQPWGRTLVEALAGPGAGTLAAWPRVPPIAAKTGTLRHTVALAGILDPGPNAPVIFCYFVNHHPERRWAARGEIASALGRWRTFSTHVAEGLRLCSDVWGPTGSASRARYVARSTVWTAVPGSRNEGLPPRRGDGVTGTRLETPLEGTALAPLVGTGPHHRPPSQRTASGLVVELPEELDPTAISWRWRLERCLDNAEESERAGDDFAARVFGRRSTRQLAARGASRSY